jgi:hypothetical protein
VKAIQVLLMLICLLFGTSISFASTVLKLSMDQMIQKADAIVYAVVKEIKPIQKNQAIFSQIRLNLVEQLKGDPFNSTFDLEQIGGEINHGTKDWKKQIISGQAIFTVGEEVLLFLEQTQSQTWVVLGMSQGKYTIEKQVNRGKKEWTQYVFAQRNTAGLHFEGNQDVKTLNVQTPDLERFDYDAFKIYLQKYQDGASLKAEPFKAIPLIPTSKKIKTPQKNIPAQTIRDEK